MNHDEDLHEVLEPDLRDLVALFAIQGMLSAKSVSLINEKFMVQKAYDIAELAIKERKERRFR